jgi:hypothetical protein
MRRREFITLLGGTSVAWPISARAQQPVAPLIGVLSSGARDSDDIRLGPLREGLMEMGYAEGRNVSIEYRWAGEQPATGSRGRSGSGPHRWHRRDRLPDRGAGR